MKTQKLTNRFFAILPVAALFVSLACEELAELGLGPENRITVQGKVTNMAGAPVVSARVRAKIPDNAVPLHYDHREVLTDQRGRYSMTYTVFFCCGDLAVNGVDSGGSQLSVSAQGYRTSASKKTCCGNATRNFQLREK